MRLSIPDDDPSLQLWQGLLKLAPALRGEWTVIGAQMVALHALEHEEVPPRASTDVDVMANTRVVGSSVGDFARLLEQNGFELVGVDAEGVGHRFSDGTLSIDLLAPDGLGPRADVTTIPPARTVSVPGGTQGLRRTKKVKLEAGGLEGVVPVPNLAGAILLKVRAVEVDDVPQAQLRDLAFLLSLVEDPVALRNELSDPERGWLRRRAELSDRNAAPWRALSDDSADAGHAAYRMISED